MKVRDRTRVEQSVEILNERLARVDQTDDALVRLWARSVNQVQVRALTSKKEDMQEEQSRGKF